MKRLLLGAILASAALAPGAAQAQLSSSLTYSDGAEFFDLCSVIGCTETINLNINTPDVLVTVADGIFGAQLVAPGNEDLLAPLPALQLTRTSATQFALTNDVRWFFDGTPDDGLVDAEVAFLIGSVFNASQTAGTGSILSSSLSWVFDPSKLQVGVQGGVPAGTVLETGSFTLNSSRNSAGATVAAYGVTVQATSPRIDVPGPLGIAGVLGTFAWARKLRRRIAAV